MPNPMIGGSPPEIVNLQYQGTLWIAEMDKPDISVIIPTYNRSRQLAQCLDALSATRDEAFEVIVVDDGSPEPAESVTHAFADRLDIICLRQKNAGPASARNAGVRVARAPILAFTDDDCLPEPDWLHKMAEAVRRDPHALVGGRTYNNPGKQSLLRDESGPDKSFLRIRRLARWRAALLHLQQSGLFRPVPRSNRRLR